MTVLIKLAKLANLLDKKGLYREASEIDDILKEAGEIDKSFMSHLDPDKSYVAESEGFMRDVDTGERHPSYIDDMKCDECGEPMPLGVQRSAAGYYIGRLCNRCGPWSRESGYFKEQEEARKELEMYKNKSNR